VICYGAIIILAVTDQAKHIGIEGGGAQEMEKLRRAIRELRQIVAERAEAIAQRYRQ